MTDEEFRAIAHGGVVPNGCLPEPTHPTLGWRLRLGPGWGWCLRCGRSSRHHDGHWTQYNGHSGCAALCERCWSSLSPEERLPWYHRLLNCWPADEGVHLQVRDAVLAGG